MFHTHEQKDNALHEEQCYHLFKELNKYRSLPKISEEEFGLIFHELDDGTRNFKIELEEFYDLTNAIAIRFKKEEILLVKQQPLPSLALVSFLMVNGRV
ncbi:hypothetical protein C5167_019348 [Papaver somniferum]|uniref:EF-hand domain-containing protein n=1 Tax=Papaver somniferum TaxID=3469 RepID=A0A4Y7ISZ5_PAPSO|nr:hypothetical protein C5167_019348 [Papaver somniferum]